MKCLNQPRYMYKNWIRKASYNHYYWSIILKNIKMLLNTPIIDWKLLSFHLYHILERLWTKSCSWFDIVPGEKNEAKIYSSAFPLSEMNKIISSTTVSSTQPPHHRTVCIIQYIVMKAIYHTSQIAHISIFLMHLFDLTYRTANIRAHWAVRVCQFPFLVPLY